jgi:hypothetical protein
MAEYPWPQSPARTEARLRGLVDSVLRPGELESFQLEWVGSSTTRENEAGQTILCITIVAVRDQMFSRNIWGTDWFRPWEYELDDLANSLEDWVSETPFAWGQERIATVPE